MRYANRPTFVIVFFLLWIGVLTGQRDQEQTPLFQYLEHLSEAHEVQFNYESSLLEGLKVLPPSGALSLEQKLLGIEAQTPLRFSRVGERVIAITRVFTICGYLQDDQFREPLAGATVSTLTTQTITDRKGYFQIEVAALNQVIAIEYLGFEAISQPAKNFEPNLCEVIAMTARLQELSPVVLTGYLVQGIDKSADGSTRIDFSKFTLLPGLIEADVLQTVQALPGIQSVDETVSNINIRGGSHDQNLILWDNIKMYKSGHFFGLISSINPQITKLAKVVLNGSDVSYTDGVSGTIHMQTDTRVQKEFTGNIGLNLLNADAFADIPLGTKSSLQVAARRSLDDLVRTPTYQNYYDRIVQETEVQQNQRSVVNSDQRFTFYDTSLRWLYQPTERDAIRVNFILLNNSLEFDETADLGPVTQTRQSSLLQYNVAGGFEYRRDWSDAFATELQAYGTDYKLRAINANVLEQQRFLQENSVVETGVRLEGILKGYAFQFKGGYHFVESEVTNLNDIDQPRFRRLKSDVIREHALIGQAKYKSADGGFTMQPGVRLNYIEKFNRFLPEPRLSLHKAVGNHLKIALMGEFKHQNTSQIINFQNDFLGIEKRRWQLADNDSIPILRSKQFSLGLNYSRSGWLLDLTGYIKHVDGITTQSQGFTTKYEFAREKGSYQVSGVDFLIRKKYKNLNTWLSYSHMVNEYTFETLEEVDFPSNFDIVHALTLGSTYAAKSWNISAGVNYRSGNPTSEPEEGNEVIDNRINFGPANNVRLKDYLRVDVSMVYKWKISEDLRLDVGGSVWNILDRENSINNFYRINTDAIPDEFTRFSLNRTTNLMLRFYF